VDEIPTHGGSLRIHARHAAARQGNMEGTLQASSAPSPSVAKVRADEEAAGLHGMGAYAAFGEQVKRCKRSLLRFLVEAKEAGKTVAGYGAPAKGNTLLNYAGVRGDFLEYTVDLSPHKQGLYLPGTRIPIHAPARIFETKPDYVLILPWNIKDEVMAQMRGIGDWGGRFVVPIPETRVL
jgi:hypothetical protein